VKSLDDPREIVDAFVPERNWGLCSSVPSQSDNVPRGATVRDSTLCNFAKSPPAVKNCRFKSPKDFSLPGVSLNVRVK
jgi:hypothetical protein